MREPPLSELLSGDRSLFEVVPLGVNCTVSHFLRGSGLRQTALPFDWNVTPARSAVELLANGFCEFLAGANLVFLPPVNRLLFEEEGAEVEMKGDVITPAVCRRYRVLFPHDFPREGAARLGAVREKYRRRIDRLAELLAADRHLIFVHHDEPLNDWQKDQYRAALGEPPANDHADWAERLAAALAGRRPRYTYSACGLAHLAAEFELARARRAA